MKKFRLICLLAAMLLPEAVNAQMPVPWVQTFNNASESQMCSTYGLSLIGGFGFECMTSQQTICDGSMALKFSLLMPINVVALPVFSTPIDSLAMSFKTYPNGTMSMGTFDVGYVTSISDSTTFVAVATYNPSDSDFVNGCAEKYVTFSGAPAGATIAFRLRDYTAFSTIWWVDDIQVFAPSSCSAPTSINFQNIMQNSADVYMSSDGNASGYLLYLNGQFVDTVYSDSYTLSGLTSNTDYMVMVYSLCDSILSGPATFASFTTECGYEVPYFEDFNSFDQLSNPRCFHNISNNSLPPVADVGPENVSLIVYRDVLFPPIAVPDSIATFQDLHISFRMVDYTGQALNNNGYSMTEVGLLTDRYDTTTYISLMAIDSSNTVFDGLLHNYDIYLSSNSYPDTINLVFRNLGDVNSIYIDDIRVEPASDCRRPVAAWIDSATTDGIYIRWRPYDDGMAHNYEVVYCTFPFLLGEITESNSLYTLASSTFPDTSLFIPITELIPSAVNHFWVRTLCSDTSEWFYITNTSAPCPSYNPPYYNDFSSSYNNLPICWNVLQSDNYGGWPKVVGDTMVQFLNNNLTDTNLIVMPYIHLLSTQMMVTATAWVDAWPPTFEIGYMTNPTDKLSFVPLDTVTATEPTEYDVVTTSVLPTIDSIWIAFRTTKRHGGYLKDVLVREIIDCIRPGEMVLDTLGHNFADFSLPGATASLYEVRYSTINDVDASATISFTTASNVFSVTSLTPLTTYYTWVRSICGTDTSDWRRGPSFTTKCGEDACPLTVLLNDQYLISLSNGAGLNVYSDTTLINFIGCPGVEVQSYEETLWVCPDMAPLKFQLTYNSFIFWFDATITMADSTVYTYDLTTFSNGDTILTITSPCPTCSPVSAVNIDTTTTTSIDISWIPADSTDNSWIVYLDNVPVDTVNTTSYSFTGLVSNTGYSFGVATNCSGTPSTIATIDTFTVCALYEPCPMTVVINDLYGMGFFFNNTVQVWSNNYLVASVSSHLMDSGLVSEDVYVCSGDSVTFRWIGTTFTTFDNDFVVQVYNGGRQYMCGDSCGNYTNNPVICSFIPDCPCMAPDTITTTADINSITVTWTNSDSTEVTISEFVDYSNGTTVYSNTGSVTFNELIHNTIYYIRLRAYCRFDGSLSEWGEVQDTTLYDSTIVIPDLPCPAPDSLELLGTTYTTATIGWIPGGDESQWEIELNRQGDIIHRVTEQTTFTLDSLWPEIVYTVRVRAICGEGYEEGGWSDVLTFTTDVCYPVTELTVIDTTEHSATVSWPQVANSMGYKIYYGLPGFYDAEADTVSLPANANQYVISGLEPETAYEVYILNKCTATLYSAMSPRIGFTTQAETGILTVDNGVLVLSPNPASDKVNINIDAKVDVFDVQVIDMNGCVRGQWSVTSGQCSIDVSHLAQGAYIVRVTSDSWTAVRKLIVK